MTLPQSLGCTNCSGRHGTAFNTPFTMAFQPIYDAVSGEVFAQEALLRSPTGGSAWDILSTVTEANRYSFDQACRTRAIEVASRIGREERISINFMPNAVYEPDHCLARTLWAADRYEFDIGRIIFEFTEGEEVRDTAHLKNIVARYRARGFKTAIDDFGAGYSGLGLLADVQPDLIKIDMHLVRGIDTDTPRQRIVAAIHRLCLDLGIVVIAEGVETPAELETLRAIGIGLFQGYLIARPTLESMTPAATIAEGLTPLRLAV